MNTLVLVKTVQQLCLFHGRSSHNKKEFKAQYILNGLAEDLDAECEKYEALLNKHPLTCSYLGGENGHIAFNEPGTSDDQRHMLRS